MIAIFAILILALMSPFIGLGICLWVVVSENKNDMGL